MTLTTEQLRARAESLGLDFFIERRAGIWVKEWLNDGCMSATAEEVMMWSMLANREAQPVAYIADCGTIVSESDRSLMITRIRNRYIRPLLSQHTRKGCRAPCICCRG
ncbi:Uncharacterised protein [Serratia marcescens]|nr:Uncharacterised protein [Serratia marcescens]CVB27817.1 Uncharacterised protein [Serratia marcescens]CVB28208.1 Uncharacterised protein [Serratia marcescens]CVB81470.1 Uncharacterised protein [Serratia marcescens]CVB82853.1 Uncharacterised protein [Serratia marcescens]